MSKSAKSESQTKSSLAKSRRERMQEQGVEFVQWRRTGCATRLPNRLMVFNHELKARGRMPAMVERGGTFYDLKPQYSPQGEHLRTGGQVWSAKKGFALVGSIDDVVEDEPEVVEERVPEVPIFPWHRVRGMGWPTRKRSRERSAFGYIDSVKTQYGNKLSDEVLAMTANSWDELADMWAAIMAELGQ